MSRNYAFYVDTPLVMHFIDGNVPYSGAVSAKIFQSSADTVFSELSRMECRALALLRGRPKLLVDVDIFFAPGLLVSLSEDVFNLAAEIRGRYRFVVTDSIHLAAATFHGCDEFLTMKKSLKQYTGVRIHLV